MPPLDFIYQVYTVRRANVVDFRLGSDTDMGLRVHPRCPVLTSQPLIMGVHHVRNCGMDREGSDSQNCCHRRCFMCRIQTYSACSQLSLVDRPHPRATERSIHVSLKFNHAKCQGPATGRVIGRARRALLRRQC
jgi:hypothetical protein